MSGKSQFSEWSPERVAAMSARNRAAHLPAQATLDVSTKLGDELVDDDLDKVKVKPDSKRKAKRDATRDAASKTADEDKPSRVPPSTAWPVFEAMLRAAKLPAPHYEFRFNAERKWRFDVAFPDHRIAVEIDGGVWRSGGGAHSHPSGILRDMEKINAAQLAGWRVLRYTPDNIARAIDDLKLCLGGT
jgi:very-short-patch-repair endonuclease